MNVAILFCKNVSDHCTGSACFKAYNNSTHSFAEYAEKPTMCAYTHCGGCGIDRATDAGVIERMERLRDDGVQRVHIGKCVGNKCTFRDEIVSMVEKYGMEAVLGTH